MKNEKTESAAINPEFIIKAKRHPLYALVNSDAINGNTRAGLTLNTEVKLNKFYKDKAGNRLPNPDYGRVRKVQIVSVMLATEAQCNAFEKATNKALKDAGEPETFEVAKHNYADKIGNSAIMVHRENGQVYLRFFPNSINKINAIYLRDGIEIEYSKLKGQPAPRKKSTVTGTNVVKPQVRNPKVESVTGIRINGQDIAF